MTISFPNSVWDGSNVTTQTNPNARRAPDRFDYDRITGELQAVQQNIIDGEHEQRITNLEAVLIEDDSVLIVETSINYEVSPTPVQELFILVDASSGDIDITLPDPTGPKFPINVKKIDSSAYVINILPFGSEVIDGDVSVIVNGQWNSGRFITNGTDWFLT
jgi:hypothetical protein